MSVLKFYARRRGHVSKRKIKGGGKDRETQGREKATPTKPGVVTFLFPSFFHLVRVLGVRTCLGVAVWVSGSATWNLAPSAQHLGYAAGPLVSFKWAYIDI